MPVLGFDQPAEARKRERMVFGGVGALLQVFGFVILWFVFPFGLILGVTLLLVGNGMCKKTLCGACGNPVAKTSRMCPHCKAHLID